MWQKIVQFLLSVPPKRSDDKHFYLCFPPQFHNTRITPLNASQIIKNFNINAKHSITLQKSTGKSSGKVLWVNVKFSLLRNRVEFRSEVT
jgi:hypothetical protein